MKQKTLCLLLLAIAITTGCSNSEQITVSNLTNTNEASIEASLESPTEDSAVDGSYEISYFEDATENDSFVGCWFVEENKPREYSIDEIECEPIDKTADCEAILLEKADRLYTLIHYYLNAEDLSKLRYTRDGHIRYAKSPNGFLYGVKIISDEMDSYSDFKSLFADSIYGDYFDYINQTTSHTKLFEVNGVIYGGYYDAGGLLGIDETWYLGYDVYDDRIVGHYAVLRGLGECSDNTPEYLNDESSYWFYDITVQRVNGVYVITSCREITSGKNYDYSYEHGISYNSGFADRSLITNERVAPKY